MNENYLKAIEILTSQGKFHICLGLERILSVLSLLGDPQKHLKIIHVAGTNGKGSTCAMLSSIFKQAGLKVGMYTSPHLINYTERIKINGLDISEDDFSKLLFDIQKIADQNEIHLTEFEILTAMAFCYFKREQTDIVVLETGLGGRLDATNVVEKPLLTIITDIDIDHTDRLGATIDAIATEKAGIIKDNVPVIVSEKNKGYNVIKTIAQQKHAPVYHCEQEIMNIFEKNKNIITVKNKTYELNLLGSWQNENFSLVEKSIEILKKNGMLITEEAFKAGLKTVEWPARMQFFRDKNLIIDGAHNPSAAKKLKETLDMYFPDKKRIWLYSSITSKDYEQIISTIFRKDDKVIVTDFPYPSAVKADIIKEKILKNNPNQQIIVNEDLKKSLEYLLKLSNDESILIVAGSLYLAGAVLALQLV